MIRYLAVIAAALLCIMPFDARADEAPLSDAQKQAVEKLLHDYIVENPELILESVRKYRTEQEAAEQARQQARLSELKDQIAKGGNSPVLGNPDGDVTMVEFFDYKCGYCKRVHGTVADVVSSDGGVRLVYKEFPVLGAESVLAARAALAVHFLAPDKYGAFHDLLMSSRGGLDQQRILDFAQMAGVAPETVKKGMSDPRVEREIQANFALAQELGINGTPAFIVGTNIVPGAADATTLKEMIAEARKG